MVKSLADMVLAAEAGDTALWEDIARKLLKAKKPAKARAQSGAYAIGLATFTDGVQVLVGGYGLAVDSTAARDKASHHRAAVLSGRRFDTAWLARIPAVVSVVALPDRDSVERAREVCFQQRISGWGRGNWADNLHCGGAI